MNTPKVPATLPTRFSSGEKYADFFSALVKLESNFRDGRCNVSMPKQVDVTLRWEDLPNGKVGAYFVLAYDETAWKPKLNQKWRLRCTNWVGLGRVIKLPALQNKDAEVGLELEEIADIPRDLSTAFSVTDVLTAAYDRQVQALEKFSAESSSKKNILYEQILGNVGVKSAESKKFQLHSIPSLPPLSAQQEDVVKRAIDCRLTLLDGPSGSGKTITLLAILYYLRHKGRILVCAPTNSVVDLLALNIHQMNLRVVRLFAETRYSGDAQTHFLSLESKIRNRLPTKSCVKGEELLPKEEIKLDDSQKAVEHAILEAAEVICCTCIAAGDERLNSIKFHAVLIDESVQATEPECLIPVAQGCEQLVLVGDECQLGPVIKCTKASKSGLERSLFQRLVTIGVEPQYLTVQYRMHPNLWRYPSTHYQRSSLSGVSAGERKLDAAFPWPNPNFPLILIDVRGCELAAEGRTYTYTNVLEASTVEKVVTHLSKRGISPTQIGIITQYVSQKNYLIQRLGKGGHSEIEVNMVDAFQGREKDIVIVSSVKSEGDTGVGSLGYMPRFHLVLTRAKFGLIIVGHLIALSQYFTKYSPLEQSIGALLQKL